MHFKCSLSIQIFLCEESNAGHIFNKWKCRVIKAVPILRRICQRCWELVGLCQFSRNCPVAVVLQGNSHVTPPPRVYSCEGHPLSTASARDLISHHTKVIRMWERMDACTGLWKTDIFISARTSVVHNGPKIDDKLQFNDYARRCVKYLSAVYTCVKVIKDNTRSANNIHLWKNVLMSDDSAVQVFLNSLCCAAHLPSPSWR